MSKPRGPPFARFDEQTRIFETTEVGPEVPDLDVYCFLCDYVPADWLPPQGQVWAVEENGREVHFEEVKERVEALSAALHIKFDVSQGNVVVICAPNSVEWLYALYATWRCGAVAAPISASSTAEEMAHLLRIIQQGRAINVIIGHTATQVAIHKAVELSQLGHPHLLCIDEPTFAQLLKSDSSLQSPKQQWTAGDGHKLAIIEPSSGTTGQPKVIGLSHRNIIANILCQWKFQLGHLTGPSERALAVLPFSHVFGSVCLLGRNVFQGIAVCPLPQFSVERFLAGIQNLKITFLEAVPPMLVLLAKHPLVDRYDLSSLKAIWSGAAPIGEEVLSAVRARLPNVTIGNQYGMTEGSCGTASTPWHTSDWPKGSVGALAPLWCAKVVDLVTGKLLGPGERGELWFAGPSVAEFGYLGDSAATAETFVDGWVRSGDEGYIDQDGYVFITERIKEMIKTKGLQVAPSELEDCLLALPEVVEACVIGVADDYAGELPRAYCVLSPAAQQQAAQGNGARAELEKKIYDHVASVKAKHKRLDGGIVFVDAIPKGPSGKLLRRMLRDRAR